MRSSDHPARRTRSGAAQRPVATLWLLVAGLSLLAGMLVLPGPSGGDGADGMIRVVPAGAASAVDAPVTFVGSLPAPVDTADAFAGRPVRDGWSMTAVDTWERRGVARPLARFAGLEVLTPTHAPVAVGFHESSTEAGRPLDPLGPLLGNLNSTRFTPSVPVQLGAQPATILASRGRRAGPTTAADVVVAPGTPVVAPVTGTVTDVRSYVLYGRYADHRVEIQSRTHPELRVVLVHVSDVEVAVGDLVIGGRTVVAGRSTEFPFASQVDRLTDPDRFPHVHLEVQPFDSRRPGDPWPGDEDDEAEDADGESRSAAASDPA